jgi:hypothetical protein
MSSAALITNALPPYETARAPLHQRLHNLFEDLFRRPHF